MTINIVGAGLAGLLAGNVLRHRSPQLHEVQPSLPNNHSAVLRFRTSSVGDVLNIPFRKVTMIKASVGWKNPIADALSYSFKNTGERRSDRSISRGAVTEDRWVAPADLIPRMAAPLAIKFGKEFDDWFGAAKLTISTLPMPVLMKILGYQHELKFNFVPGINVHATIANCDAFVSLMTPDPAIPFSRISITGDDLIIESANDPQQRYDVDTYAKLCVGVAADLLGVPEKDFSNITCHKQRYAKITPIDDTARKNFLFWATDKHNIFSLGRFAIWRPGLLLDDLVQDLRKIDGWMSQGKYAIARHR
jgi:hypothetical protein